MRLRDFACSLRLPSTNKSHSFALILFRGSDCAADRSTTTQLGKMKKVNIPEITNCRIRGVATGNHHLQLAQPSLPRAVQPQQDQITSSKPRNHAARQRKKARAAKLHLIHGGQPTVQQASRPRVRLGLQDQFPLPKFDEVSQRLEYCSFLGHASSEAISLDLLLSATATYSNTNSTHNQNHE